MKKFFTPHSGIVLPLDQINIDTDAIIPKQFLTIVTRTDFSKYLFYQWRYKDVKGKILNLDFIINKPAFNGASIMLTRENFGCGSSREHAIWALLDYGIKVIIGSKFPDIFSNNAFNNFLLLVELNQDEIEDMFQLVTNNPGIIFTVDLEHQQILYKNKLWQFTIEKFRKYCLLRGIDIIDVTLQHNAKILDYEKKQQIFLY